MAITKTTDLTNSVKAVSEKKYYMMGLKNPGVWGQFINWESPVAESGGGGSSYDFPIFSEHDLAEDALTEDADVTPDTINDGNGVVTPAEYGKVFAITKKAKYQSRVRTAEVMGEISARNRVRSIDRILRRSATGRGATYPTMTYHIDASAAMSSLTAASGTDTVTWAFLMELQQIAASMDIEPFDGGGYKAIVHPSLIYDLMQLAEWKGTNFPAGGDLRGNGLTMKPFELAGITFLPSNLGRLYLGSGTALQAATTLNGAVAKGATRVILTDATGIVAGNYITIGTLETESVNPASNLEQVMVTVVNPDGDNANELTIRANGNNDSFGLRFSHASGESVVEAYNVAAIPLIGKNSLIGVYGSDCGEYGVPKFRDDLDLLNRFDYYGWYWYGGVGVGQKRVVLGKCAVSRFVLGYN